MPLAKDQPYSQNMVQNMVLKPGFKTEPGFITKVIFTNEVLSKPTFVPKFDFVKLKFAAN